MFFLFLAESVKTKLICCFLVFELEKMVYFHGQLKVYAFKFKLKFIFACLKIV